MPNQAIDLNPKTVQELTDLGFSNVGINIFLMKFLVKMLSFL